MDNPELNVGKNLRRLMKQRHNITFDVLSKDTGIPKTSLFNLSNNIVPQSKRFYLLKRLANYFNISLDELMFGKVYEARNPNHFENGDVIELVARVIDIKKKNFD